MLSQGQCAENLPATDMTLLWSEILVNEWAHEERGPKDLEMAMGFLSHSLSDSLISYNQVIPHILGEETTYVARGSRDPEIAPSLSLTVGPQIHWL